MKLYMTRDEDGLIHIHLSKPEKGHNCWHSSGWFQLIDELPAGVDPQWEDDEPIEVIIKIRQI